MSNDTSCQRVIDYIQGWFKQINCDGVPNRDCYMLCDESNICCMFNEILEMCDSSSTTKNDPVMESQLGVRWMEDDKPK